MNRLPFPLAMYVLCGVSMLGMGMVGSARAAEEVQVLRNDRTDEQAPLAFTTFQQEEAAIAQSLPCKWISKDGRVGPSYGSGRYDYLCKGGDFATITLYLDKSGAQGVGSVRLIYRDWLPSANPNAAEAQVAQQFLQHVAGRFVPMAQAGEVMDAFWSRKERNWSVPGLKIDYEYEQPRGAKYVLRKLSIKSTAESLSVQQGFGFRKPSKPPAPPTEILIYDPNGNLVRKGVAESGAGLIAPTPVVTPTDAGLSKPVVPQPSPAVLPAPVGTGLLPVPGMAVNRGPETLGVPATAPAGPLQPETPLQPLQKASTSELSTAPEPESLKTPPAPPAPSEKLVPTVEDLTSGTRRAPSNFDIYNRATELTRDVETKAQTTKVEEARVTASKPEEAQPQQKVPTEAAPPLKPVPTPSTQAAPSVPAAAGLTQPVDVAPAEPSSLPANYQGPRSSQERPLPQLKFIPKAEPVQNPTEVIKFEDESSAL